jgi:hypothetical protein
VKAEDLDNLNLFLIERNLSTCTFPHGELIEEKLKRTG